MSEQLVAGATVYRKRNGSPPLWLVIKNEQDGDWELPKGLVRRGESSVGSILRILREEGGMVVEIIEEAGRATASRTKNGSRSTDKIIFYLSEMHSSLFSESIYYTQEKWLAYSRAKKALGLEREKRILKQANDTLKECLKKRKN
ncbi:MAG: NUDIX domain-containing protein [Candidatus Blackburnbacteria bacterium]|nr:NUDIX domain-containing protein [Candidatus Blackburnbacteria bacterium]